MRRIIIMAISVIIGLSGCSKVSRDESINEQMINQVDYFDMTAIETDMNRETVLTNSSEETPKTEQEALSSLYKLSCENDIDELLENYALGYAAENSETDIFYSGDIGELKEPYKGIDLNGDGVTDSISRIADESADGKINVKYCISITNGPEITTKTATDYKYKFIYGGDVFEFNDINNDGYDEVLHALYYSSTKGFWIKDACLCYVLNGEWNRFDFCDELDDIVGAELTDDGIAMLVDYADKWSCCFDVFFVQNGWEGQDILH